MPEVPQNGIRLAVRSVERSVGWNRLFSWLLAAADQSETVESVDIDGGKQTEGPGDASLGLGENDATPCEEGR